MLLKSQQRQYHLTPPVHLHGQTPMLIIIHHFLLMDHMDHRMPTEPIHQTALTHLTLITKTLDKVTIRQTRVTIRITIAIIINNNRRRMAIIILINIHQTTLIVIKRTIKITGATVTITEIRVTTIILNILTISLLLNLNPTTFEVTLQLNMKILKIIHRIITDHQLNNHILVAIPFPNIRIIRIHMEISRDHRIPVITINQATRNTMPTSHPYHIRIHQHKAIKTNSIHRRLIPITNNRLVRILKLSTISTKT